VTDRPRQPAQAIQERWRRIPLRARLTTIAAAAVAVAVLAVSVSTFLLLRQQLRDQFDRELLDQARNAARTLATYPSGVIPDRDNPFWGEERDAPLLQFVGVDGDLLRPINQAATLPVSAPDLQVVRGEADIAYSNVTIDGDQYRMVTVQLRGGALEFARQPVSVEETLAKLALLLTFIGAAGVVGAAVLGWTVARAGLAPVDRLTAAAEHVAATQDLTAAIPVTGDDEVARLGRAFNAMLAALGTSRDDQRRLVEDAGHELRTPLTSLRTNIELLLRAEEQSASGRSLPAADRARLLRDLDGQMVELTQLTSELVELARNDAAAEPEEQLDLADIVVAAVERARVRVPGVLIETELTPAPITGRPSSLERAVLNVLDNAAKWTPPGTPIQVRLTRQTLDARPWAVLEVEDQGPGVAEEDLPRVFERFYRSASARAMPGSGLGLAIVRQAIAGHGGTATIERAPGGGALLRIVLPSVAWARQSPPAPPAPEPRAAG
jgi:two-component system sensor histidine kinase MprB